MQAKSYMHRTLLACSFFSRLAAYFTSNNLKGGGVGGGDGFVCCWGVSRSDYDTIYPRGPLPVMIVWCTMPVCQGGGGRGWEVSIGIFGILSLENTVI